MRTAGLLVLTGTLAIAGAAAAQPTPPSPPPEPAEPAAPEPAEPPAAPEPTEPPDGMPPPDAAPPPVAGPPATVIQETRFRVGVGLFMGLAQGDWQNVNPSPGIRVAFGASVMPNFSLHGMFRYTFVQPDEDVSGSADVSVKDLGAGARYTSPIGGKGALFGEGEVIMSTVTISADGESLDLDGIGFLFRAGGEYSFSPTMSLITAVGFSFADVDFGGEGSISNNWLSLEGGVEWKF